MAAGVLLGTFAANASVDLTVSSRIDVVVTAALYLGVGFLVWWRWTGVDLGPTGFRRRGLLGNAAYWAAVEAVTLHRGRFGAWPVIWLKNGERIALREFNCFPFGSAGAERAYHQIGQWWLGHRGPGWRPYPAPAHYPVPDPSIDPWRPPPLP